jgi:heat shock protein HslJ
MRLPLKKIASVILALLVSAAPLSAQSLTEMKWIFTQIGEERLRGEDRTRTSFVLDPASMRLAATAGCNRMAGGYRQDGVSISFTEMAMTRMACPPPLMQRESALASALRNVRQWRIVEGNLILSDANGTVLLRLFAASRG